MQTFLESITSPAQLKELSLDDLEILALEIRDKIIQVTSVTGGHLASNLGIVELSLALHYVFDSPSDKFIFDVSHQTYPHKMLTGRFKEFATLRQYQGLSGFSSPDESPHDHFYAGHAGTALSLALGVAKARDLNQEDYHVIPVLGDAALTCGLTLEALNNTPKDLKNNIIILNDNAMSISKNVGAVTTILSQFFNNPTSNKIYREIEALLNKTPAVGSFLANQSHKITESLKNLVSTAPFFEQFGLSYVGPIDGHNVKQLISTLEASKNSPVPILLHVMTVKGHGMEHAIQNPTVYHGVRPFEPKTGKFLPSVNEKPTFPKIFGQQMMKMIDEDPNVVIITPAMPAGSCITPIMDKHPTRCIDVGIAEGHAVTYAGGIGYDRTKKVVACIYATFLQRALDNLFQDVCLQNIPVVFALDRGGIAGGDGVTHNGIYDIGFLNGMPNMIIAQPRNGLILRELLNSAFDWKMPTAIRYPNLPTDDANEHLKTRVPGQAEILSKGHELVIIGLGHHCETAMMIKSLLAKHGITPTILDPIFLKPLDEQLIKEVLASHRYLVTIEEHSLQTGLASILNSFIVKHELYNLRVLNCGVPDVYVQHGSHSQLMKEIGLDAESIAEKILHQFYLSEKQLNPASI